MLIQPDTKPQGRYILELGFVKILLILIELLSFFLQLLFLLGTLISANVNVYLVRHDAIVTKLNGFVKPKTVCDLFRFLQLELHYDFVEFEKVKFFLLNFL